MGLSNQLNDVSSDSIPILLVAAAAGWVSYLRSLLLCLLHSLGLLSLHPDHPSPFPFLGSSLAGLVALADHLNSNRPFPFHAPDEAVAAENDDGSAAAADVAPPDCVVCLSSLADGDRIRRLACCHVFHSECLDGWWFDQMNLSCPLCRSPMAPPPPDDRCADAERRIGAELVAWLSPY